jgi:Leucine-rich repeat (LRR) protein
MKTNFFSFYRLEELRIEHNLLQSLPNTLKLLRNLKSLQVSNNRINKLPDFMIAMRFNNGVVSALLVISVNKFSKF